jgi:hypothetical protein
MNITVTLTGALPVVVILSALLTAVTSVLLLWFYRRAVVRAMGVQAGTGAAPSNLAPAPTAVRAGAAPLLTVVDCAYQPDLTSPAATAYRRATRSLNRAAIVYALGGLVCSLVLTAAWMITAGGGFILTRFLWLLACYSWPVVLAVSLINPAAKKRTALTYFGILFIVGGIGLVRNPALTVRQLVVFWCLANGPGTVLLFAFLRRRVRAVGPLVLAFMVAAITGAIVLVSIVGSSQGLLRGVAQVGSALGLGARAILVLLDLSGFALFGLLGWPLLRWLGRRYQKKRTSDLSITLDALWLLFAVDQSFTLVFEGWGWIFTGPVAFAACKLAVQFGFSFLARRDGHITERRTLLLLRVFLLGKRSERLFDAISRVWLRAGSISLIAGPDLVTSTVEPHEFLNFVGGHMARQFVSGEPDLKLRVSNMDFRPDPDGRHRVNEFFCRADTWQMTMQALASRSDAVLMDLRGFSKSNQGCVYELRQLFNSVPLDRLTLVIDDTADRAFLETTLSEIWRELSPTSPNAEIARPAVRCFPIQRQTRLEVGPLLAILFGVRPSVA